MNGYEDLSLCCKALYEKGLAPGCSGNASIRKNAFIAISPSGCSLNDVIAENIVEIDFDGNIINKGKASTEKMMHIMIYKNRPDINAIIHTHSPFLSTFALNAQSIENSKLVELPYLFQNKVPLVSYHPPGSEELARETAEIFKTYDAALLENHGAIIGAKTIKDALYKYEVLEYMAQVIFQEKLLRDKL